jgi:hypothetical protein
MAYLNDTKKIVTKINALQADEILRNGETWEIVIDEQQDWLIETCPALYLLELAADMIQPGVSKINLESYLLKLQSGLTTFPNTKPDKTCILKLNKKIDFEHNGNVTGKPVDNFSRDVDSKIENYKREILLQTTNLNPTTANIKNLLCFLSLSFGDDGGHFAALIATETNVYIFDPYFNYYKSFEYLAKKILEGSKWDTLPIQNIGTTYFEIAIHATQKDPPTSAKDKVIVQDSRNQDHFCWAWCILCFHSFLANNCKGVNIHAQQDLAFQYAVCYGHFEIVKFLVENGANIHTCNNYAFNYADIYKHYDILEYLNDCVKPTQIPSNATCNECCVCLDIFESYADKPKNWKILKCHHKICIHCYHKLINNTNYTNCHNCPICRAKF